jgi:hypothetical protein
MNMDTQVENSRRVYGRLLNLYPKEHREEYGQEMARLFSDQCNSTVREHGSRGLMALWLRTLWDLGKSALVEHFSSSSSTAGLLQATPGKPLPWKGVFLVLVPGLIFFICQVGTLNGEDWFFTIAPWVGYALMIPVLLTWIFTRKFPVWGLVPLGLALFDLKPTIEWQAYRLSLLFVVPLRNWLQPGANKIVGDGYLGIPLIFLAILFIVIWLLHRQQKFDRRTWLWLGIYTLLTLFAMADSVIYQYLMRGVFFDLRQEITSAALNQENSGTPFFLLLILLGAFLARRHGKLAILLLVGYWLPTIVYGQYAVFTGGNTAQIPPVWINGSVLAFRLCLALLIPVWLVRSTTHRGQIWATLVPVTIALVAQAGLRIAVNATYYLRIGSPFFHSSYIKSSLELLLDTLVTAAGFILALMLYKSIRPVTPATIENNSPSKAIPVT